MNIQDLINEEANLFIKELNGREFTVADYRNILFGNCSNILKSKAKKFVLTNFVTHPSVQLRGVGNNGVIMDKYIEEADFEIKLWEKEAYKKLKG